MQKRGSLIVFLSAIAVIAVSGLGFVVLRGYWDGMHSWDRRVARGFQKVVVGMPREQVQELMRSPGTKLDQFRLGQEAGFERQYAEAEHSKSAYWLSWQNGIDYVYTIGFDEHDRVTYKASGGT
jgi:hypothetical protein